MCFLPHRLILIQILLIKHFSSYLTAIFRRLHVETLISVYFMYIIYLNPEDDPEESLIFL